MGIDIESISIEHPSLDFPPVDNNAALPAEVLADYVEPVPGPLIYHDAICCSKYFSLVDNGYQHVLYKHMLIVEAFACTLAGIDSNNMTRVEARLVKFARKYFRQAIYHNY